jgi:hypothetical protein
MWWAALFSGENGKLIRNIVIISLILTVLAIVTVVLVQRNKKKAADAANEAKINQYEEEIQPQSLTFSESEYENMAAAIDTAIGFWSDDEEAIKQQFMLLKTNSDLLKLQAVFGTRSDGHDLFSAIRRNLNTEEIQELNTILAQRNISIRI